MDSLILPISAPLEATIEVTYRCNLNCRHCYLPRARSHIERKEEITIEMIERVVEQLADMGVFLVIVSGGEPFCREDLFAILEILEKNNIFTCLVTNGTLISKEIAEHLATFSSMKSGVQVSVDGASPKTHDLQRGKGTFRATLQGIRNLLSVGISPTLGITMTKLNVEDLVKMFDLCGNLGIIKLHFVTFMPSGVGRENWKTLALAPERMKIVVDQIEERSKRYPEIKIAMANSCFQFPEKYELSKVDREFLGCRGGTLDMVVTPEGDVIPCALLRNLIAGNVKKERLVSIWRNAEVFKILKNRPKKIEGICKECTHMELCAGGCPASAYNLLGDVYAPDPMCPVVERA